MPAIFSDFNTVMAKTNKQTNTLRKYASFFGTSYMCLVDFFSFFFFFRIYCQESDLWKYHQFSLFNPVVSSK